MEPFAERRQLTVVYCDMVESTRLQQQYGMERYHSLQQKFIRHCLEQAATAGAARIRYTGDGFAFGRFKAGEHDCERALRFGLNLVRSAAQLRPAGVDILLRLAVSTGDAVVELPGRDSAVDQSTGPALTGPVLNRAARLLEMAGPGEVVAADLTRRLASGLFEYRDLGASVLRGFEQAEHVWAVLGESSIDSRFEALRNQDAIAFVGRDEERHHLEQLWREVCAGSSRTALISGEAGIGKSRLTRWVTDNVIGPYSQRVVLNCRPDHHAAATGVSAGSALEPVCRYFRAAAGIEAGDDDAEQEQKLRSVLSGTVENIDEGLRLVRPLIVARTDAERSPASPDALRERRLQMIVEHFHGLARSGPALVVFEDAHWADAGTHRLVEHLACNPVAAPVLFLVTARVDDAAQAGGIALSRTVHDAAEALPLAPLSPAHSARIAAAVLGAGEDNTAVDDIVARADGIPLFVEDLSHDVRDSHATRGSLTHDNAVPRQRRDVLMSALDRLDTRKRVAQVASVIGREFSVDVLAEVLRQPRQRVLDDLDVLADGRVLLPPERTRDHFQFRHALVRDTAYLSLLESDRAELHWQLADALQRIGDAVAPDVVARHLELAAKPGFDAAQSAERCLLAAQAWCEAAKISVNRSEIEEALARLEHAGQLLTHTAQHEPIAVRADEVRLELWSERAYIESMYRGWSAPEVSTALDEAYAVCERLGNPEGVYDLLMISGGYHLTLGEIERGGEVGQRCLDMAQNTAGANPRGVVIAHRSLAGHAFLTGEHQRALDYTTVGLQLCDEHEDSFRARDRRLVADHRVSLLIYRELALLSLGYVDQAIAVGRDAIRHAEQMKHGNSTAHAKTFFASTRYHRRDGDALSAAEDAYEFARNRRFATFIGASQMIIGAVLVRDGEFERGIAALTEGAEGHARIRADTYKPFGLCLAITARISVGQAASALPLTEAALGLINTTGEKWYLPEALRLRGECLAAIARENGDSPQAAIEQFDAAIAEARRQGARFWHLRAANSLARVQIEHAGSCAVEDELGRLVESFDEGHDLPDLNEARSFIAMTA